jgi:hypothetical protein
MGSSSLIRKADDWSCTLGWRAHDAPVACLAATETLGKAGWRDFVPALKALLVRYPVDEDPVWRSVAASALANHPAVREADGWRSESNVSLRMVALLSQRRRMEPGISAFLADSDPLLVVEAARAINDMPIAGAYPALAEIARRHGLKLIADSAQGFGCTLDGHHPIHWADVATTSFFPAKPLGAYGDGGAVLSKDARLHDLLVSLRVHGQAAKSDIEGRTFEHDPKYLNMRVGMNSRMDTLQAAILLQKLTIFADEIEARNRVADRYAAGLAGVVETPVVIPGGRSVWAQYTVKCADRDGLAAHLKAAEVPTAVYYPIPIHQQAVYSGYPAPGGLPVTNALAGQVLSLPMHPYLAPDAQDQVIAAVRGFFRA